MRRLIVFLFLFSLLSTWQLFAQSTTGKIRFGANGGYAFYSQDDLNSLNQSLSDLLPFDVSIIDDFKPVFFWGGYLQYRLSNHFLLGPSYEYHYSGSRAGARDYSGVFTFDQYIHMHQIGLKMDYALLDANKFSLAALINGGVRLTDWKIDSNLEIGDNGEFFERDTDHFEGFGWYVSPAVKIEYRLTSQVALTGTVAYSFDLKETYHYKDYTNSNVVKSPDWSGVKLALGIEFLLF